MKRERKRLLRTLAAISMGLTILASPVKAYTMGTRGCETEGHAYAFSVMTEPTSESEGILFGMCSQCMNIVTTALPKLNTTDYSCTIQKEATCLEEGLSTYTWYSAQYGEIVLDVTLPKTEHRYQYGMCITCGAGNIPSIISLRGTVTDYGNPTEPVTLSIYPKYSDVALRTLTVTDGSFALVGLQTGEYTLSFSKKNHATREYEVQLFAGETVVDAALHLLGDVNVDGRVDIGDVSVLYAHNRGTLLLSDAYQLRCANVNGDGLDVSDVANLYAHIKGTEPLY